MKQLILSKNDYEIKIALLEDEKLVELYIENIYQKEIVGNIYKGEVVNILNDGEIIFLDIGFEKNAFLAFEKKKFGKKFNVGDKIIVQVEAPERDNKGAKVTLDYSINRDNLVLLPNSKNISISKKIKDENERDRLKNIFLENQENGIIIRTASEKKSEAILKYEYERLIEINKEIKKNFENKKLGLLYDENNLFKNVVKNIFDKSISEFIVEADDRENFLKIREYLLEFNKEELSKKLKKYFKDEKIFDYYKINSEIKRARDKKVWLKSGGYLIIEKTEALVSIDVNTGQNTDKTIAKNIFNTNLEATKEIVRQLRLRNLSGIIIIDFINMKKAEDRKIIFQELKKELEKDRVETNLFDFTPLGLIQITRKRQGKELEKYFYEEPCEVCEGSGKKISFEREVLNILEELDDLKNEKLLVQANKKIVDGLKKIKPDIEYKIISEGAAKIILQK